MCALRVASRGVFSRNLMLDDDGIWRGRTLVAWDDVDHYRYDWNDWSHPGDLVVISRRRAVIRISPTFDQWPVVADRVLRELHRRLRDDPYFAPFAIDKDALVHPGAGRLRFSELANVELAPVGPSVVVEVHARGAGVWAEADISQIACPWLWLDVLAARGVVIGSPLDLHLPPVLVGLADRIAATRDLPRARIVR